MSHWGKKSFYLCSVADILLTNSEFVEIVENRIFSTGLHHHSGFSEESGNCDNVWRIVLFGNYKTMNRTINKQDM